jgi:hypothetical protein
MSWAQRNVWIGSALYGSRLVFHAIDYGEGRWGFTLCGRKTWIRKDEPGGPRSLGTYIQLALAEKIARPCRRCEVKA